MNFLIEFINVLTFYYVYRLFVILIFFGELLLYIKYWILLFLLYLLYLCEIFLNYNHRIFRIGNIFKINIDVGFTNCEDILTLS
jgi:hypothetical protein